MNVSLEALESFFINVQDLYVVLRLRRVSRLFRDMADWQLAHRAPIMFDQMKNPLDEVMSPEEFAHEAPRVVLEYIKSLGIRGSMRAFMASLVEKNVVAAVPIVCEAVATMEQTPMFFIYQDFAHYVISCADWKNEIYARSYLRVCAFLAKKIGRRMDLNWVRMSCKLIREYLPVILAQWSEPSTKEFLLIKRILKDDDVELLEVFEKANPARLCYEIFENILGGEFSEEKMAVDAAIDPMLLINEDAPPELRKLLSPKCVKIAARVLLSTRSKNK